MDSEELSSTGLPPFHGVSRNSPLNSSSALLFFVKLSESPASEGKKVTKDSSSTPPPHVPQTHCVRDCRDHNVSWTQVSTSSTLTAPFPPPLIHISTPLHVLHVSQLTCIPDCVSLMLGEGGGNQRPRKRER